MPVDDQTINIILTGLGCTFGLVPLVLSIRKKQLGTGVLALLLCAATSYILSWLAALVLAGVEFWVILQYEKRARERAEAHRLKKHKIKKQREIEELERQGVTVVENADTRNLWPPIDDGRNKE